MHYICRLMKKLLIQIVVVLQVLSIGTELFKGFYNAKEFSMELTEKKAEKKSETCEDDCKEKFVLQYVININSFVSKTQQYLEFSTRLYKSHLNRIELPPELI
jgi:hypothetical protein